MHRRKQVMKCKVTRVEKFSSTVVSQVTCGEDELGPPLGVLGGIWIRGR